MSSPILREDKHGLAILTLNRPEKLNALSKDVFEALDEHVETIARETKTIGLVVLRGSQGNSALGWISPLWPMRLPRVRRQVRRSSAMCAA
jgi:enoyl-CoA hydratase/carnithine racemase